MVSRDVKIIFIMFACVACIIAGVVAFGLRNTSHETQVPSFDLASMSFIVFNISETRLSAKWDLSTKIPNKLPNYYLCHQGDIQASFLYKNVTLVTTSPQKYNLENAVSAVVSEKDISGLIGKDIMEDIKEKKEVRFRSQLFFTDCKQKRIVLISYACDEATLRFEPGPEMKANVFGNPPRCYNI